MSRTCLPTSKKERERVVLNAQKMTLKGGNPAESGKKKFTSTKRPRKVEGNANVKRERGLEFMGPRTSFCLDDCKNTRE